MPHSIVVAQFDPKASSFWLPPSGRLTAARIPTGLFWAIRFHIGTKEDDEMNEVQNEICVISPLPSLLPLRDASLTIGPKQPCTPNDVLLSTDLYSTNAQLTVRSPLRTSPAYLDQPLYLHTAPLLSITPQYMPPIERIRYQLDEASLLRFKTTVWDNIHAIFRYRAALNEMRWKESVQHEVYNLWSTYTGRRNPMDMVDEIANPHTYVFDFHYDMSPWLGSMPTTYEEIMLYADVCKDYRWTGVEAAIAWVRTTRLLVHAKSPSDICPNYPKLRILLKHNTDLRDALKRIADVYFTAERGSESSSDSFRFSLGWFTSGKDHAASSTKSNESEDDTDDWQIPSPHPTVAESYPRIAMHRPPRTIVFDIFGTVLDREDAIRRAIVPWLSVASRPRLVQDAVRLYIELEALAAREKFKQATSLPTAVHSALHALASKLGVPATESSTPGFIADAAACILRPRMYPDVAPAIAQLVQLGCTVVLLAPNTLQTSRFVCAALSRAVLQLVRVYPTPVSVHYFTPMNYYTGLQTWCRETLQLPDLVPGEVLVASSGMGRIIASASLSEHPTVLVRRPGNIEAGVRFVVGEREFHNPAPTVVVGSLEELCLAVRSCQS